MSEPETASPAPAPGRPRWLIPLLVASIAVNLVVVGAVVSGQFWPRHDERRGFHRSADLMPRTFFRELDDARREALAEVFRARKPEFREQYRALRGAATALANAIEREPYDPGLAQAAIAEHTERSHRLVDLGATVAGELVPALTPEERKALAAAIRQRLEEDRQRYERRRSR